MSLFNLDKKEEVKVAKAVEEEELLRVYLLGGHQAGVIGFPVDRDAARAFAKWFKDNKEGVYTWRFSGGSERYFDRQSIVSVVLFPDGVKDETES